MDAKKVQVGGGDSNLSQRKTGSSRWPKIGGGLTEIEGGLNWLREIDQFKKAGAHPYWCLCGEDELSATVAADSGGKAFYHHLPRATGGDAGTDGRVEKTIVLGRYERENLDGGRFLCSSGRISRVHGVSLGLSFRYPCTALVKGE
jgi:hypothetical protein